MADQRFVLSAKDYLNRGLDIRRRDLTFNEAMKIQDDLASKGYDSIRIRKQRTATMGNPAEFITSEGKLYLNVTEDGDEWKWELKEKGFFGGVAYEGFGFPSEEAAEEDGRKFAMKMNPKKLGRTAQERVSKKIGIITREEKHRPKKKRRSPEQIAAIAYSMEREHKLPHKRRNPDGEVASSTNMLWFVVGVAVVGYIAYQYYQNQLAQGAYLLSGAPSTLPQFSPGFVPQSMVLAEPPDYGNGVMG
jgi:hypothetical protein